MNLHVGLCKQFFPVLTVPHEIHWERRVFDTAREKPWHDSVDHTIVHGGNESLIVV